MEPCNHQALTLLPPQSNKLRCRTCHLIIAEDEVAGGHCPECYDADGVRRTDFERMLPDEHEPVRYRCENCGAIIEC